MIDMEVFEVAMNIGKQAETIQNGSWIAIMTHHDVLEIARFLGRIVTQAYIFFESQRGRKRCYETRESVSEHLLRRSGR